jgi:hypothetical protein
MDPTQDERGALVGQAADAKAYDFSSDGKLAIAGAKAVQIRDTNRHRDLAVVKAWEYFAADGFSPNRRIFAAQAENTKLIT